MNLLTISVANTPSVVESTPGNILPSTVKGSQVNEFTSILSDSLAQQGIIATDAAVESTLAGQQALATRLPVSGQNLPPTGKSLPLDTPTLQTAEMDADANTDGVLPQLMMPALIQEEVQTSIAPSPMTTAIAPGPTTTAIAPSPMTTATEPLKNDLPVSTAIIPAPVSEVFSGNIMSPGVSAETNLLKGITVAGTVPTVEAEVALQANVSINQKPLQSTIQGLPMTQVPQEKSAVPTSTSNENAFNGGAEQRQLSSLPEMPINKMDEKQDFSRIIEKGLGQIGKEMPAVNTALVSESSARMVTESLKTPMETLQLQQHIDRPKWSQEFANKMVWVTKEGLQSVQLRLTPAHLGTIEVKIAIQNDQANISFMSQHGAVRDIIEASMPRLREMLNEAGVKLEQFNVSTNTNAQQQKQHAEHTPGQHHNPDHALRADEEEMMSSEIILSDQGDMLSAIDYYA